jgi:hypothetical protein
VQGAAGQHEREGADRGGVRENGRCHGAIRARVTAAVRPDTDRPRPVSEYGRRGPSARRTTEP